MKIYNRTLILQKVFMIVLSMILLSSCIKKKDIVIASKNYTENIILAELMATLIQETTDITVKVKDNLGSTFVVLQALESGDIDLYPGYTGTLYQAKLKQTRKLSAEESFNFVKRELYNQYNWVVFDAFGFNNTYAIGLLKERADELGLKTISDLQKYPDLVPGFDNEFIARADGGIAMLEYYGIDSSNIFSLEIGLRYKAIQEKKADYTDVYSTDSKLKRFEMIILEDDKNFFPAYYAIPVARKEIVEKYPEIISVLALLANSIDEKSMIDLNYQVEENKIDPKEAALQFLQRKELL